MNKRQPHVDRLPETGCLRMGETIIEKDCTGEGLPVYSADKGNSPWAYSTHFNRINRRGSIVIGARGTIGFPRLPKDPEFGATQTTIVFTPDREKYLPEYIHYALQQVDFLNLSAQQAVPMLTVGNLESVTILRFPLSEQAKIAEVLSMVDQAIEHTEALIGKQQRIKAGLMQDLLTRGIDQRGNLRSEETHQFKDSPLGRVPVEWDAVPLKELAHIKHGYAFPGEFFTEQRNENVLLTPGNFHVKGGLYFTTDNTKYFTGPIPDGSILSNGDVLVVMTDLTKEMAILGRTVILDHPDNVLHNQRIGKVLKNREVRLDPHFLVLLMNSDLHRNCMKATATGTTVRHTSPEKLLSPLVPKVPIDEQVRIREAVQSIENSMNCTSKELAKALRLRAALMQDLLTGKVRVTALLAEQGEAHV